MLLILSKDNPIVSRNLLNLYLLWWITLPMGSKLFSLNLHYFVLYPNLFISLIICGLGVVNFLKWDRIFIYLITFLLFWIIQGGIQLFMQDQISYLAVFDFRSLLFQFITAFVISTSYYHLSTTVFNEITVLGIRFSLIILLLSGVFEAFTGIHPAGKYTDKLVELQANFIHYAPVYVYDNPNDYLAHFLFFTILIILFDAKWNKNIFILISLFITCFFFSELADSKFGKIASIILLCFYLINESLKLTKKKCLFWGGAALVVLIMFISNPLYFGPKYDKGITYRINELVDVERTEEEKIEVSTIKDKYTPEEQAQLVQVLDSLKNSNRNRSENIRKSLILNGITFIKEKPVFGIGPGQFYYLHDVGEAPNYTGTVNSAHNFPIEAISSYGVIAWGYFLLLFFILMKLFHFRISNFIFLTQLIGGLILCIIWMMPSNFLYLEIHRLVLPLLIVLLIKYKEGAKGV